MEQKEYKNPSLTVDAIILASVFDPKTGKWLPSHGGIETGIVLIKRKNPPHGWALPGGFCDDGESVEDAIHREVKEETGLTFELTRQFHVYSDPKRDPRQHVVTVVFLGCAQGVPIAADDAKEAGTFSFYNLPEPLAFDHKYIIQDFLNHRY